MIVFFTARPCGSVPVCIRVVVLPFAEITLLLGAGPGLYVDLERFTFHVPSIGSGVCLDIRSSCYRRQRLVAKQDRSNDFRAFITYTAIGNCVQGILLAEQGATGFASFPSSLSSRRSELGKRLSRRQQTRAAERTDPLISAAR